MTAAMQARRNILSQASRDAVSSAGAVEVEAVQGSAYDASNLARRSQMRGHGVGIDDTMRLVSQQN